MPATVSNPRDLLLQLLGDLLYVERRLAGGVLLELADSGSDGRLRDGLEHHLVQTKEHVERCEAAFRKLDASPTANAVDSFESALRQHEATASSIVDTRLADAFHAQVALRTEHLELALYEAVLALGFDELSGLRASQSDEDDARRTLEGEVRRLLEEARAR